MPTELLIRIAIAIVCFLAGFFLGEWNGRRTQIRAEFDSRAFISTAVPTIIMMMYVATWADAQFFDGHPPSWVLGMLAAASFGSLIGEREYIIKVLTSLKR